MVHKVTSLFIALAFLFSLPAFSVRAASGTATITDCSEAGLNAAISAANASSDTFRIYFDCPAKPATIKLTGEKFIEGVVIIDGGGQVTLDGQGRTRIFNLNYGGNYFLSNITLQNGFAANSASANGADGGQGGAIFLQFWSHLHLTDTVFINNVAETQASCSGGGAITLRGYNTVEIDQSQFNDNKSMNGGALNVQFATLTVRNSSFTRNAATHTVANTCGGGGAIYIDGIGSGMVDIASTTFTGNTTNNSGGAIFAHFYNVDRMRISNSIFSGNQSVFYDKASTTTSGSGGAIWFDSDDMVNAIVFTNSTLENNSANASGGGIYADGSPISFTNVTFDGNKAQNTILTGYYRGTGGGIAIGTNSSTTMTTFTNVTLTHNYAAFSGGGIIAFGGGNVSSYVQLANTLLSDNIAGNSRQYGKNCQFPYDSNNPVTPTPFKDLGGNVQYPDVSGVYDDYKCTNSIKIDQASHVGSLSSNGGLVINGAPLQTVALTQGSAAIGDGNPAYCPATDQRRYFRNGACDSGAYEFNGIKLDPSNWNYLPLQLR
jgi:predicted outer membrane repeat protein